MRPGSQVAQHLVRSTARTPLNPRPVSIASAATIGRLHAYRWTHGHQRTVASALLLSRPLSVVPLNRCPRLISSLSGSSRRRVKLYSTNAEVEAPKKAQELPSSANERRSDASKRFSRFMDRMESSIFIAGQRLNDLTGYTGIDALRREIEDQGQTGLISTLSSLAK